MKIRINESAVNLVKTNKPSATKLFNSGKTVYLLPNKVRLDNMWIRPFAISIDNADGKSFDAILNSYSFYNCNSETGNGIAFYKES